MTEVISSGQNKHVRLASSLKNKKYRDELGLFMVEGARLTAEAVRSGLPIEYCFFTCDAAVSTGTGNILKELSQRNCRLFQVEKTIFNKMADTENPQGILAVLKKPAYDAEQIFRQPCPFIAVLDRVQDPGNVGTIIRTADAAGCTGVVLTEGCADLFSGKTIRATMGSVFHLNVCEGVDRARLIDSLKKAKITLAATALEDSFEYYNADLSGPLAVVFGNEGGGIAEDILSNATMKLRIPIFGKAESLNVAMSAAIVLYEAARQRRQNLVF